MLKISKANFFGVILDLTLAKVSKIYYAYFTLNSPCVKRKKPHLIKNGAFRFCLKKQLYTDILLQYLQVVHNIELFLFL